MFYNGCAFFGVGGREAAKSCSPSVSVKSRDAAQPGQEEPNQRKWDGAWFEGEGKTSNSRP